MSRAAIAGAAGVALLLAAGAGDAAPARYRIDPEHLSIGFRGMHIGYASVIGLFGVGQGSFVFDETTRALSDLRVTIAAGSVHTGHKDRDGHLRSSEFLDAETHPSITFVMREAVPAGERAGKVTGDLTIRGVTRPVTLEVTWNKSGTYPYNDNYVIGISARTSIRRSEFGMTYAVENGWVGDVIPIEIELEAIRE